MTQARPSTRKRKGKRPTRWTDSLGRVARTPRNIAIGVTAMIALVGVMLLLFSGRQDRSSAGRSAGAGATADAPDMRPLNSAVLFYVAEDGTALVREERDVDFGEDTLARARIVAEAQLSPPLPPLLSPVPEGTVLRALYLADGGDAFVDLSSEATLAHPGGSLDELFTVYALVNALTTNLPEIRAVQILIEGQEVDTLAGHVDLRRPLARNMKWVAPVDTDEDEEDSAPAADN